MRYRNLFSLVYFGALFVIELGVAATIAQRISNGLIAAALVFVTIMLCVSAWQYGERYLKKTETRRDIVNEWEIQYRGRFASIIVNIAYGLYFLLILILAALLCRALMFL